MRRAASDGTGKQHRLAANPLFEGCRPAQLSRLAAASDEVRIDAGEIVLRRGRADQWFYVVDQGSAEVVTAGTVIRAIGPGDWFGGALGPAFEVGTVTVRATTPMVVFVLNRRVFLPLVDDVPALRGRLPRPRTRPCPQAPRRRLPPRAVARTAPRSPTGLNEVARLFQAVSGAPPPPPPAPQLSRRVRISIIGGLAAAYVAFAVLYHLPVGVMSAGRPIDITDDITITGLPVTAPSGRYVITWVKVEQPTLLGLAGRVFRRDGRVLWDYTTDAAAHRASVRDFADSQRNAAAAAARLLDLPPLSVRFRPHALGGPSAGLVYALAIVDMLDGTDLAAGRVIAATGTIDADGDVGVVGGLPWKVEGAQRAGAALFLVPRPELGLAAPLTGRARGVQRLDDAVSLLRDRNLRDGGR